MRSPAVALEVRVKLSSLACVDRDPIGQANTGNPLWRRAVIIGAIFGPFGALIASDAGTGFVVGLVAGGIYFVWTLPVFGMWLLKKIFRAISGIFSR